MDWDLDLDHYLNPIALIICYFVVATTSNLLLGPKVNAFQAKGAEIEKFSREINYRNRTNGFYSNFQIGFDGFFQKKINFTFQV